MAGSHPFYDHPILNSPYACPTRHWELNRDGVPTHAIKNTRRPSDFLTPIPKPRRQRAEQGLLTAEQLSPDDTQEYLKNLINKIRHEVTAWRALPEDKWQVTSTTKKLLRYWRTHWQNPLYKDDIQPFFCQIEAVETVIWLTEVAPQLADSGQRKASKRTNPPDIYSESPRERAQAYLHWLNNANAQHNAGLPRLALKLATGAGKTTVMAMLIAWQTLNAVRERERRDTFAKAFLVITPGITIRDRLRVLLPNDAHAYYTQRQLVPHDMLGDMRQARVVITNYHALRLRETLDVATGTRALLEGRHGTHKVPSRETEGQMLQRVASSLLSCGSVVVFNDEAHHCYMENTTSDPKKLKGDELREAEENRETARVWFSGLDMLRRYAASQATRSPKLLRIFDLSATPFFLSGSGYVEGTIFPWTMSDFSLMDAIECGIVKLPRVPVSDNIKEEDVPLFRDLWKHIRAKMPKKTSAQPLDPLSLPGPIANSADGLLRPLCTAIRGMEKKRGCCSPLLRHCLQQHGHVPPHL